MQLSNETANTIRRQCMLRQFSGTPFSNLIPSTFFTAYAPVRDAIGAGAPNSPAYMKFFAGALTGAIGSIAG